MILLIDNFDSFVFNLARYIRELGGETVVVRNDEVTVATIATWNPQAIVISPGPCSPNEAGISVDVVRQLYQHIPILGVCLGHQAIGAAFGATVQRAPQPVHGRKSSICHNGSRLFAGIPSPFVATRYHSLIVDELTLPAEIEVTAWTDDGLVMALEHRLAPLFGVQFHPESILTECGHQLLANFLSVAGIAVGHIPSGDSQANDARRAHAADHYEEAINDVAINSRWVSEATSEKPLHW